LTYLSFASFNALYHPVRLIYGKKTSSNSNFDTALYNPVRLTIPKIRYVLGQGFSTIFCSWSIQLGNILVLVQRF